MSVNFTPEEPIPGCKKKRQASVEQILRGLLPVVELFDRIVGRIAHFLRSIADVAGSARDGNSAAAGPHLVEAPLRMAQPLAVELLSLRLAQVVQHFPAVGAPIRVAGAGAGAPLRGTRHS